MKVSIGCDEREHSSEFSKEGPKTMIPKSENSPPELSVKFQSNLWNLQSIICYTIQTRFCRKSFPGLLCQSFEK